jgi:hypothetical protein
LGRLIVARPVNPAGVLALFAGLLSLAMSRSPTWPALAGGRLGGTAVITGAEAAAVYSGVVASIALFTL